MTSADQAGQVAGRQATVLVHGAWGGSYGYRYVRPMLSAAGHDVFTPSLTGIGERSHLAHPGITLTTHIHDVVNTILYEDLRDIVLLGFSYGGMVVTGALDHIGDRVAHLVYLDSFVPDDGQSIEMIRGQGGTGTSTSIAIEQEWRMAPLPRELDDPAETEWFNARRTDQPMGTFSESVRLRRPVEEWDFTRTYIKATADPGEPPTSSFWAAAHHARESPAWSYHEVETNHLIPMNRPAELVEILTSLT